MSDLTTYYIARFTRLRPPDICQDYYLPVTGHDFHHLDLVEIIATVEDECEEIDADNSRQACKFVDENVHFVRFGASDDE